MSSCILVVVNWKSIVLFQLNSNRAELMDCHIIHNSLSITKWWGKISNLEFTAACPSIPIRSLGELQITVRPNTTAAA